MGEGAFALVWIREHQADSDADAAIALLNLLHQQRTDERAKVVAYVRGFNAVDGLELAHAIERGEHDR